MAEKKEEVNEKPRLGIARFEKEASPEKKIERRMYPRFLLNLPIEYSHLDSPVSYSSRTINVSEGGLMICLGERLEPGQHLNSKIFYSSDSSMLTFEATVQVMWAEAHFGKDGNYRHGVKFEVMKPEDLQNFKGFLDGLSPDLIS
jgi:c-di-GMP-binding flagellar brake protein YcgR